MNVIEYEPMDHVDPIPVEPKQMQSSYEKLIEEMCESEQNMEFMNKFIKMIQSFTTHYFLPIADNIEQLIHSNK